MWQQPQQINCCRGLLKFPHPLYVSHYYVGQKLFHLVLRFCQPFALFFHINNWNYDHNHQRRHRFFCGCKISVVFWFFWIVIWFPSPICVTTPNFFNCKYRTVICRLHQSYCLWYCSDNNLLCGSDPAVHVSFSLRGLLVSGFWRTFRLRKCRNLFLQFPKLTGILSWSVLWALTT